MRQVIQFANRFRWFQVTVVAALALMIHGSAWAQFGEVVQPPESLKVGFDSITAEQSKEFLSVLAGPGFEGRGTGQAGYTKAAHWVAGKLAEYGLEPVGDNGTYFQMLPMKRRVIDIDQCSIRGPEDFEMAADGNFGLERFTNEQVTTGDVVFIQFSDPTSRLPEDLSLRDKIVVYSASSAARNVARQIAFKRPLATAANQLRSGARNTIDDSQRWPESKHQRVRNH